MRFPWFFSICNYLNFVVRQAPLEGKISKELLGKELLGKELLVKQCIECIGSRMQVGKGLVVGWQGFLW